MLNVAECIMPGATGVVFRATLGPMPLVIKAIPPGWKGVDDLLNEAVVYETLASLQGIALPRSAGLFDGHGWLIIILEDVGRPVTVVSDLSLHQREKLWQQACSIHASGVLHHDLELRNLVTSSSGEVRIVDYAYARLGHQCDASTCVELKRFRGLLDNHLSP
ncbi:kinase-like domain-containing protein [Mycena rebaudengoi]|nr:kinase-like domain-containing protein [Mycena rebaudengoi]